MPVAPEIYAKVTNVLMEVLVVDKGTITPTAVLQRDLGADSLDLLEIMFRLEQEFNIDIRRDELFPQSIFREQLVGDGKLTDHGLSEIRSRLPYADWSGLQDRRLNAIADLFTMGLLTDYVTWKLKHGPGTDEDPLKLAPMASSVKH
jgi:acyl carrier protein